MLTSQRLKFRCNNFLVCYNKVFAGILSAGVTHLTWAKWTFLYYILKVYITYYIVCLKSFLPIKKVWCISCRNLVLFIKILFDT